METSTPEDLGFSSQRLGRIDSVMQRYVDERKLAGMVTLVARHGKLAHLRKFGMADIEAARPMQFDTIFRIYSMTKTVTSVAALMLMEEGRFRLSDPLSAYLPAFKAMQVFVSADGDAVRTVDADRPIAIHDLFIHTSGLGYGIGSSSNAAMEAQYQQYYWGRILGEPGLTLEDLIGGVARMPLLHQPGKAFVYSVGLDVLALLVKVVSGLPFETYLQRNLFEPLGMTDTAFYVPPEKLDRFAAVYGPDEIKGLQPIVAMLTNGSYTQPTLIPSGGGGLVSTARDYWRFAQMLLNKGDLDGVRVLGRKTVVFMMMNHLPVGLIPVDDPALGFGLGGSVLQDVARSRVLGSAGTFSWGGAANTEYWVDPAEGLVGLLMLQYMPGGTYPVGADFRNLVYQALAG
ncbi:MAG: beta-lactamase family protein [Chloroflexi bacterium]|nr:beta-lactamase family protein [Chloroflexota bacterium]